MFWDPSEQERRRRLREAQRRAQEQARQQRAREQASAGLPPALVARVEEALNALRAERDEWQGRHTRALSELEKERAARVAAQAALEEERRARQERAAQPPAIPAALLERFEGELATAQRERDEWEARYQGAMTLLEEERAALAEEAERQREELRAAADAQRERLTRNAEQRAYEDNRKVLLRLLEVADNLGRALGEARGDESTLAEGLRLTHRSFMRALEQAGVEPIESVGAPFDPELHEAVGSREAEALAPGSVAAELQPGYRFRGALLRPARVIVSV